MDAIILAGGLGTRLQKTIPHLPKPLAPINNIPFLEILLSWIARFPLIEHVVLATGYKADAISDFCRTRTFPFSLTCSIEAAPLGTGGAVKLALHHTSSETVAVLNGDSFFDVDLTEMYAFHLRSESHLTLACSHVEDTSRYGSVTLDAGQIVAFHEKQTAQGAGWISGGIYLFNRHLPLPSQSTFSLEKDLFPAVLKNGVFGYCSSGQFIDIGTEESYRQAQGVFA